MNRIKGIFILEDIFTDLYSEPVKKQIYELVDIYAPRQRVFDLKENPCILSEADILFAGWGMPFFDSKILDSAENLKVIFYAGGTMRYCLTEDVWERGIKVTNAVEANALPVSEYTLSQILFSLKCGWQHIRLVKQRRTFHCREDVPGAYKSVVGIISLGTIGRQVCEKLKGFDVKVLAYDPFMDEQQAENLGVELCSLERIFTDSDVVSLHAPAIEQTRGMITGEYFNSMKTNATFINTARGMIVREKELIDVFTYRKDLTAVLDVTYPEPPEKDSPLYDMDNIVLTPHIAGSMGNERQRMGEYMLEELKRYLAGKPLKWEVSLEQFMIMA